MLFAIIISAIALLLSVALHLFNISVVADKFVGKLSKVWTKTQAVVFIAICSNDCNIDCCDVYHDVSEHVRNIACMVQ